MRKLDINENLLVCPFLIDILINKKRVLTDKNLVKLEDLKNFNGSWPMIKIASTDKLYWARKKANLIGAIDFESVSLGSTGVLRSGVMAPIIAA